MTELLVVIVVIVLLIGILLPVLASSFIKSKELASSVNLRSISQIFDLYINENRGMYPVAVPDRLYPTPRPEIQMTISHWNTSEQWHLLFLADYPWEAHTTLYIAPGADRDINFQPSIVTIFSSYRYSASFLGKPRIWSGDAIGKDEWPSLEKGVRQSMVRYPSAKVLMWDVELPTIRRELKKDDYRNLRERSPMLFADRHVETRVPAEANVGVTNWAPSASNPHQYLHNTRNGVYGRDY